LLFQVTIQELADLPREGRDWEPLLSVEDEVNDPLVHGFNQAFITQRDLVLSDHFLQH